MAFLSSSQIAEITNPARREIQIAIHLFLSSDCRNSLVQRVRRSHICTFVKGTAIFLRNCKSSSICCIILTGYTNEKPPRLTEAHAAESLKDRQYDDPTDVAFAFDAKHQYHEDQHKSRLTAHYHELRDHVGE